MINTLRLITLTMLAALSTCLQTSLCAACLAKFAEASCRRTDRVATMYRERPSSVPHSVLWMADPERDESHRVLPDGCMDLIWYDDQLIVAGPDTAAEVSEWRPSRRYVGLRFAAGVGPRVLGVPGHVVRDQRLALSALWPRALVRQLSDQLRDAAAPGRILEAAAAQAMRRSAAPDPLGVYLLGRVRRGDKVADIASDAGLTSRQVHRRSLDAFGYGPKVLARIVRMNRGLELARGGLQLADVALQAGYADQAHMAREVKALAGVPMTCLLASP